MGARGRRTRRGERRCAHRRECGSAVARSAGSLEEEVVTSSWGARGVCALRVAHQTTMLHHRPSCGVLLIIVLVFDCPASVVYVSSGCRILCFEKLDGALIFLSALQ